AFDHLLTIGDANACAQAFQALHGWWFARHPREALRWADQLLAHELSPPNRLAVLAVGANIEPVFGGRGGLAHQALAVADAHGLAPPWPAYMALMMIAEQNRDLETYKAVWPLASQAARSAGNSHAALQIEAVRAPLGTPVTGELIE